MNTCPSSGSTRNTKPRSTGHSYYSKADPNATFMRMREHHIRNGQLKHGYNLKASPANSSSTTPPTKALRMPPHLEDTRAQFERRQPQKVVGKGSSKGSHCDH